MIDAEFRRNLAAETGCRVIEEPPTPEGHEGHTWCDEHDAEWPCPPFKRVEAAVERVEAYWRERYEDMAMRYGRLGERYDSHMRGVRPALARAWDEGARHGGRGVLPSDELARRNPYRDCELAEVIAEYWRMHHDVEGPVADDA